MRGACKWREKVSGVARVGGELRTWEWSTLAHETGFDFEATPWTSSGTARVRAHRNWGRGAQTDGSGRSGVARWRGFSNCCGAWSVVGFPFATRVVVDAVVVAAAAVAVDGDAGDAVEAVAGDG